MALLPGLETIDSFQLGFLLHCIIEIPAAANFFVFPSGQLRVYSPQAHAIIRQYALLLLTSVLISVLFLLRPVDELSGQVAGALSLYHVGPSVRSLGRLRRWTPSSPDSDRAFPFQAAFYLVLHTAAGATLAHCCWVTLF
jgi:hypothetical protein